MNVGTRMERTDGKFHLDTEAVIPSDARRRGVGLNNEERYHRGAAVVVRCSER